jgi:hypothetical protein
MQMLQMFPPFHRHFGGVVQLVSTYVLQGSMHDIRSYFHDQWPGTPVMCSYEQQVAAAEESRGIVACDEDASLGQLLLDRRLKLVVEASKIVGALELIIPYCLEETKISELLKALRRHRRDPPLGERLVLSPLPFNPIVET